MRQNADNSIGIPTSIQIEEEIYTDKAVLVVCVSLLTTDCRN